MRALEVKRQIALENILFAIDFDSLANRAWSGSALIVTETLSRCSGWRN